MWLARRELGAENEFGLDVWLGGCDMRSESILEIASASVAVSGTELGVKACTRGDFCFGNAFEVGEGVESIAPGGGTGGLDIVGAWRVALAGR